MKIEAFGSGSSGNCYILSNGKHKIIVDAGISANKILEALNWDMSSVAGVLISHEHRDHCKAVPQLIKLGMDIYALQEVFTSLNLKGHRCKVIEVPTDDKGKMNKYTVGSFEVIPFDVKHDVANAGFYIHDMTAKENLLYFTDTHYIKYKFPNLHYIMGEVNYSSDYMHDSISDGNIPLSLRNRLVQTHMSLDAFINFLQANDLSQCKKIYLMHLSDSNSNEIEFKEKVQETTGIEVFIC